MTVTINGSTGVSLCAASSVPSAALQSGVPSRSQLPAGTVLQVVQGTLTSSFSTSSGTSSPAETGLSAAITPTFSTSKILVMVSLGEISTSSNSSWGAFLYRSGTKIGYGNLVGTADQGSIAGGIQIPAGGYGFLGNNAAFSYLDSPATTSAITYSVRIGGNGSATIYLNIDARQLSTPNNLTTTASTIILMEIAA